MPDVPVFCGNLGGFEIFFGADSVPVLSVRTPVQKDSRIPPLDGSGADPEQV